MRELSLALALLVFALSVPLPAVETPVAPPTRCTAPEFQKVGEFSTPVCGAPAADTVKISGKIVVTNRKLAEIKQAVLVRKAKLLAFTSVTASANNPNTTDVSFEYTEPASSYQPPVDLVIVPTCGAILSISVDRPGRCEQ